MNDYDLIFPDVAFDAFVERTAQRMTEAGIDPAFIHAWRKTGILASESNWKLLTPEMRREWNAAVREYRRCLLRITP